jgi:hypothetical protein
MHINAKYSFEVGYMLKKSVLFLFFILLVVNCVAQQLTISTPREAAALEVKLKRTPDDADSRKLLIYYYTIMEPPAYKAALQRHRLALVQNNPEEAEAVFLDNWLEADKNNPDYIAIKKIWLKQIAANKENNKIRFNAVEFFNSVEMDLSEKILKDGQTLDADNLEYYERLVKFYNERFDELSSYLEEEIDEAKIKEVLGKLVTQAKIGLSKIDQIEYDIEVEKIDREKFLVSAAEAYLELADLKNAREFAGKLLDALGKPAELSEEREIDLFQTAMSIAGRIELREGNVSKAREYLLGAIASVNKEIVFNPKVDIKFLEEFLVADGKRSVLEYLKQLEAFDFPVDLQTKIKSWQLLLAKGKIPAFENFYNILY